MKRVLLTLLLGAGTLLGLESCGSNATDGAGSAPEPTTAELDAIDAAAQQAAEQITPESAEAEFERLKAEIGHK
jgi:hypothetical protein